MNPQKRRAIFERLRAANPDPRSELRFRTPFELLVAVVLSAQATDKGVNKATARLFPVANTPAAFVKLGIEGLIPYVSSIGLFNMKAKNLVALSRILIERHGGEVPRDREALEKLPGVGRKTANVVMNVAFGEPTIAVDTHIFRVANRTRLAPGKDPEGVEQQLLKVTPEEFRHNAHHWLILHGRYVCIARVPKCPQCVIADLCEYKAKTRALPAPSARALPLLPPPSEETLTKRGSKQAAARPAGKKPPALRRTQRGKAGARAKA
jgi:endonuclease-3